MHEMHELNLSPLAAPPNGTAQPALAHMLDIVDYGIVLLRPNGQVVFVNQAARIELDTRRVLGLENSTLRVRHARDTAALSDALAAAVHKGCQRLLALGEDGAAMLGVAVMPLLEAGDASPSGAMLVLGKRKVCDDLSSDAFARMHRLTMAEDRVLKLLCAGHRPAEIAGALGVALSTVRTQTSSILEKTGMASIGALVRELARLPPLRGLLRAA